MKRGVAIGLLLAACSPARSEPPAATVVDSRADPAPETADPGAVPQRTPVERVWKPSEVVDDPKYYLDREITVRGYLGACKPYSTSMVCECCIQNTQLMVLRDTPHDAVSLDCHGADLGSNLPLRDAIRCRGGCTFECAPPLGALVEVTGTYAHLRGPGSIMMLMSEPARVKCIEGCE